MKLSNVILIIAIAAVLLFFIFTYAFPGSPAWLVFIAAGLGIAIASGVMGKDDKDTTPQAPQQPQPTQQAEPTAPVEEVKPEDDSSSNGEA